MVVCSRSFLAVSFKLSHLLARFPFLAKTGLFLVFFGSFFRWFFGTPFGGQRVAQGGRFEALFLTFGVPFWVPNFGIVFWLILGCPREGKSCVFYVRVFKNRLWAYLEKVPKMTSKMAPFRHPLGAKIMFFRVPKKTQKKVPQKWRKRCQKWLPEGTQNRPKRANKGDLCKIGCLGTLRGSILEGFGYLFWWFLGTFLLYFQVAW